MWIQEKEKLKIRTEISGKKQESMNYKEQETRYNSKKQNGENVLNPKRGRNERGTGKQTDM